MKKILKYGFTGLIVLTVVFLTIGMVQPQIEYTAEVFVRQPVSKSFWVYLDISKMHQWLEGFKSIRPLKGIPGSVGSEYEVIMEVDGEEMVMKEVITAFQENELVAFTLDNDVLISDTEVYFTPSDNGTKILAINRVRGKNAFWRSLFVLSRGIFEQKATKMYHDLKVVIESDS